MNLRRRKSADLQSAPFGHSGTPPKARTAILYNYFYIVNRLDMAVQGHLIKCDSPAKQLLDNLRDWCYKIYV